AADLDPARLKARGALMLRDFLAYAASQASALPAPPDGGEGLQPTLGTAGRDQAPDPLRAEFVRRLRQAGLVVHESFGSAQPIDIAVEDPRRPGRVVLAVETDGPSYAAMHSTRDRDRLRVEQLGRLGWEHVRVWTTDIFRDPARDVARVVAAAHRASEKPGVRAPDASSAGSASTGPGAELAAAAGAEPAEDAAGDTAEDTGEDTVEGSAEDAVAEPAGAGQGNEARKRRLVRRRPKVAPEQTRDDTDAGWGEFADTSAHDRWLQEQRPPHWGTD
ncbi:MAG TPA: DNA helicase, partial [Pedococcus sp.]|nr:DNA helicase [Pedococcus sp.]